ncbi:hypothetical protein CLOM_g12256 [Closterium sp. NIES-68]|nr:hypothetical protein CLOM_g12256 [Closterium sp. NIES-68]GJP86626.1 hypothetical protein CLOP_g16626 [Closterium sp. NIES-67]
MGSGEEGPAMSRDGQPKKQEHLSRSEQPTLQAEQPTVRAKQPARTKASIRASFHWRVALPALVAATLLAFLLADPLRLSPVARLPFDPVVIDIAPPPPRSVRDPLNRLAAAEIRYEGEAFGPESLAWDVEGRGPYAAVGDGRVVRRTADGSGWETFAWASPLRTPELCDRHPPFGSKRSAASQELLGPVETRQAAAAAAALSPSERVATAFGVFPSDVPLAQPTPPSPARTSLEGSSEGPAQNGPSSDAPSELAASLAAEASEVESSQQGQQGPQPHQAEQDHYSHPDPSLEHICGRPLGMRFHPVTGELWFADAYFGLCKVGRQGGQAHVVVAHVDGRPLLFANDLDIAATEDGNGTVYFTDTSTRFQRRDYYIAIAEGRADGRLMQLDLATGRVTVLVEGLAFANGVALSRDKSFLVLCETTTLRCHRYWLRGPKAGTREVFVVLPGMPDNVRLNPRGRFWIAVHSRRKFLLGGWCFDLGMLQVIKGFAWWLDDHGCAPSSLLCQSASRRRNKCPWADRMGLWWRWMRMAW